MIAELGLAALWLAAALAATQMVAGFLAVRDNGTSELAKLIRPAAIAQGVAKRASQGNASNQRAAAAGAMVAPLAQAALACLNE